MQFLTWLERWNVQGGLHRKNGTCRNRPKREKRREDVQSGFHCTVLCVAEMDQGTVPEELPIGGAAVELSIQTATADYFALRGKRLALSRPIDRDVRSTFISSLSSPGTNGTFQMSLKMGRRIMRGPKTRFLAQFRV